MRLGERLMGMSMCVCPQSRRLSLWSITHGGLCTIRARISTRIELAWSVKGISIVQ